MFKDYYTTIFKRASLFHSQEEFINFESKRININISRFNSCVSLLFPLIIFLLCFDIILYYNPSKKFLFENIIFYLHLHLLLICILWNIYYKLMYSKLNYISNRIVYWTFSTLIIYICTLISISNNEISAFIIIIFCACTFMYIPLIISIPTFGLPYLITIIYILSNENISKAVKITNIANSTITLSFSLLLSYNVYMYFLKDYKQTIEFTETNKKLKELENSKSLYFTNFSHELKTPLNIIYSAQQMLKFMIEKDNLCNDSYNKYLSIIKQNTNRLTKLIGNLIDISKLESSCLKIRPVNENIVQVIEDICDSASAYINYKGLSFIFDTSHEEIIVSFDPDSIERIILNLLSNSIKFTPRGGKIFVYIELSKDNVYITVKDTGIGIPKNVQGTIFNRFVQAENAKNANKNGSGIGLALVKSLTELHGGNISLYSKINEGTTFTISIPNRKTDTILTLDSNLDTSKSDKVDFEFSDL